MGLFSLLSSLFALLSSLLSSLFSLSLSLSLFSSLLFSSLLFSSLLFSSLLFSSLQSRLFPQLSAAQTQPAGVSSEPHRTACRPPLPGFWRSSAPPQAFPFSPHPGWLCSQEPSSFCQSRLQRWQPCRACWWQSEACPRTFQGLPQDPELSC